MNEKYIFGLVVIATTIFVTISMASNLLASSGGNSLTSLMYHTSVCIYKNGELIGPCSHNLVTDVGKEHLEQCLSNAACGSQPFVNMSLANCTNGISAGDTTLCNGEDYTACDLGPATGTYVSAGTGAWNITYEWTANSGCSDLLVNATGLYNNTHLFAENNFTSVTLQGSDRINVTWGIWVT
jgi:hypothetical protein